MSRRTLWLLAGGLAVATVLAFWVSRYASSDPDGLEKVAADRSLDTGAQPHPLARGPLADYSTEGVTDQGTSTGVAGVVGVAVTFALTGTLVSVSRRLGRRTSSSSHTTAST